jgi:hypothetical protein
MSAKAAALAAALWTCAAQAHDTWLEPRPGAAAQEWRFNLGTGERFPTQQSSVGRHPEPQVACTQAGDPAPTPLWVERDTASALVLRGDRREGVAATCWARMVSLDIELPPQKVAIYLDEVRAPAAVRQAWAQQQAQGHPWVECFTKFARFDGFAPGQTPPPAPLGLDIRPLAPVLRSGDTLRLEVLRDGAALPGQAVQVLSADAAAGFWLQTDALGHAELRIPLPGRWMARAVHLLARAGRPGAWDSRFATLVFEVLP